jgi:putative adenylate-forming enzyme
VIQGLKDYFELNRHLYHSSPDKIKAYQKKKVMELLKFSMDKADYYKNSFRGYPLDSFSDFYQLPIINKQIMMDNFDGINTCGIALEDVKAYAVEKELNKDYLGYYQDQYVIGLSSGTSGNKGIYITSKELTEKLPFVFLARSGISLKLLPFRILFLLRVFSQGFEDINAPFLNLQYLSTMTPVEEIIKSINENRINILMAPPSLIRLLLIHKDTIKQPLKMVVTYAEVLEEEEKARFKDVFNTKVIEIYQASEGQIGSTCRCGNLHINEDMVFVELYDEKGQEVTQPDQVATKMLVTNLVNYAQPLIRYEMNDLVVLGEKCECGSSFRVIKKIIGRNDDVMYFYNSKKVFQHVFPDLMSRWIITTSDNIREFKVLQNSYDELTIVMDLFTDENQIAVKNAQDVKKRIKKELLDFDIDIVVNIEIEKLSLPKDNSKGQRFFVKTN